MSLLKCPKCGEMFSDSYKTCPFCAEDEAFYKGEKKSKKGGRRMEGHQKNPSILGPVMVVVVLLLAGLVVYMFFSEPIGQWFQGLTGSDPEVVEPVDPDPSQPDAPTLTLSQSELTLSVGAQQQLTVTGGSDITWASSNEAVATVGADGTVTAVASGSATITAMSGSASVACTVTVSVPVEDLKITCYGAELDKVGDHWECTIPNGETVPLVVEGTEDTVTWASSDSSKVTVSAGGSVQRVADGKITLTATVGGQTLTCVVYD